MPVTVFEWSVSVLAAGGGLSFIVYQIFKKLAEGWLDDKFKSRLQELAHIQNKEIERLRSDLTKSFDRATKLHQREFEVLPMVWDEVHEAFWSTASFVSSFQSFPDINRMKPEQLQAFLEKCELEPWQKAEILSKQDRNAQYLEYDFWHRLHHASRARQSALNKVSRHAIFMDEPLKDELMKILERLNGALIEHQSNHETPILSHSERLTTNIEWVKGEGRLELDRIETRLRKQLWSLDDQVASV